MIYLVIYLIISAIIGIIGGYRNLEDATVIGLSLFWPLLFILIPVLIIMFSPYYLGKWIKEYKTHHTSLFTFIKHQFGL